MVTLTIPDAVPYVEYTVGGTPTASFAVPFPITDDLDLVVRVGGASGVTLDAADYAYTPDSDVYGGYPTGVILLDVAVSSTTVEIWRDIPVYRTSEYGQGPLSLDDLNADMARVQAEIQDVRLQGNLQVSAASDYATLASSWGYAASTLASQQIKTISAPNGSFAGSILAFLNSNGVSWSTTTGSAVVASVGGLTTAALSDHSHGNPTLALTNLTGTTASNSAGLTLSLSAVNALTTAMASNAVTLSNIRVSGGTTSNLLSAITFGDANGVSFGLNAGTMTASHGGLTTAALSNHSHGNPTLNLTNLSGTTASNSAGFTLSLSGAAGAAQTNQTLAGYAVGNTTGQSSSSTWDARTLSIQGAGIASVGWSNGSLLISAVAAGGGDGGNTLAAGTQTASSNGNVVFANSNGITFGMSGSTQITASHNGLTTAMLSNAVTLSNIRVSGGTTSNLLSAITFADGNGVSFGLNAGTLTASHNGLTTAALSNHSHGNPTLALTNLSGTTASNSAGLTLSLSAVNALTTAMLSNAVTLSNIRVSGGTTSNLLSAITFADSNGVSFGLNAGTLTLTVQTNYLTTAALSNHSHGNPTLALTNLTGTTASNSAGFTLSLSAAAAGGGGIGGGVSTGGNTAGSTGTVTTGNIVFVGSGPISLSQSTGAAGSAATISIIGPATSSLSATGMVSISSNGSTISIGMGATRSMGVIAPMGGFVAGVPTGLSSSSLGQNSLYIYPVILEDYLTMNAIKLPVLVTNSTSAAASVQKGLTYILGIYTRHSTNNTLLSRRYSTSYTMAASHNSNVSMMLSLITAVGNSTSYNTLSASSAGINISASLHGARELIMPVSSLFTPGEYFFALLHSTSSVGAGGAVLNVSNVIAGTHVTMNRPGVSLAASLNGVHQQFIAGTYSATTASMPASISATGINQAGTFPIMYAVTGTA